VVSCIAHRVPDASFVTGHDTQRSGGIERNTLRLGLRAIRGTMLILSSLAVVPSGARGQQINMPPRIAQAIDDGNRIVLGGNTHPLARPEFDEGEAPSSLPLERMLLVLRRSPEQQADLEALLAQQQQISSPDYHKWLTPQQFGQRFGPADSDIETITAWLESHGFRVKGPANGRVVIEFSGTAAQLRDAFHTTIHKYQVNGKKHWANSSDPEIPAALAPVVAGIATIHNFLKAPQLILSGETVTAIVHPGVQPQLTFSNGMHALGPQDFATIYGVNGAYSEGNSGGGVPIAVVGRSDINVQDVANFKSVFGLSGNIPEIYMNGPDPGDLGGDEEGEAVLDTTWASAIAYNAAVILVVSATTNTADGVDLSELYIVDNDTAEIMTESFGSCEAGTTSAEAMEKSSLAEQAAAEGITYFVSTGDSGAEGCDSSGSESVASGPLSVNVLAASPYVVAVGGTQFNENGNNAKYWNSSTTTPGTALGYIPEDVWNNSCTAANCPSGVSPNIYASGGGSSTFYQKPPWQTGVPGIPSGGARDLPDVSLNASASHDPYVLCLRASCVPNSQGEIRLYLVGGTSASTPSFASIMALVVQKTGSAQGQANYVLYPLAAQETLSACNGSSQSVLPATTCIFNDVTVGNNAVPGESGYGSAGASYQSGVGYDLATGLGSVNVTNLVNGWANARSQATQISSFTLMPTFNIMHGTTPVNFSVTVAPQVGTGTPTGDVSLVLETISNNIRTVAPAPVPYATLSGGSASGTTLDLPGGVYSVYAHYSGDGTYLPSYSSPVIVNVSPEPSSTVVTAFQGTVANPQPLSSVQYGSTFSLGATVTGQSGIGTPSGQVGFLLNSNTAVGGQVAPLSSGGQGALLVNSFFPFAGQYSLTAYYYGDSSFSSSTSPGILFTVETVPTTLSLQSSAPAVVTGQQVTLTATLKANSLGNPATGNVAFLIGGTQIGMASLTGFSSATGNLIQSAALTTSQLPMGTDTITAQYAGDMNYQASSSTATQVSVSGTFLIAANPLTVVVPSPGQSGSTTLTFQAAPNFTGSAMLSPSMCANLPPESSCSFSPNMVNFTASTTSVPVTFTVSTTAPSTTGFLTSRPNREIWMSAPGIALLCAAVLCLLLPGMPQRSWRFSLAKFALAAVALSASCGGGGGSSGLGGGGGGGGQGNPGTPTGSYSGVTLTVTINGSTQSVNNLVVQVQ